MIDSASSAPTRSCRNGYCACLPAAREEITVVLADDDLVATAQRGVERWLVEQALDRSAVERAVANSRDLRIGQIVGHAAAHRQQVRYREVAALQRDGARLADAADAAHGIRAAGAVDQLDLRRRDDVEQPLLDPGPRGLGSHARDPHLARIGDEDPARGGQP